MKILFAGTPWMAADILRALLATPHEIVGVLTRQDAEVGRKKTLTASAVATLAVEAGIPVIKANRVDEVVRNKIAALNADYAVIVAYGAILDRQTLNLIPKGWTNVHYSLLPDWRGAAPVQQALAAGDRETGVTLFDLDEGMDTGDIYLQVPTAITPDENAGELLQRLGALAITALNELLPQVEAGIAAKTPQSQISSASGQSRVARKPSRTDARLDFTKSAIENESKIRAFNPEPMAWTTWQGEPFRVLSARSLGATDWGSLANSAEQSSASTDELGTVSKLGDKVLVSCGSGTLLELKQVQPAGKKPMSALDWYRGAANQTDLRFE